MGAMWPCEQTDAERITASITEPQQFAPIFDRHASAVHRYLASRVGQHSADDLLSEVFVIAFRGRDSYDSSYSDARPWLLGIATNAVRHHRRAETRRLTMVDRVHGFRRVQHQLATQDVAGEVLGRQQVEAMKIALARLDHKFVDVLVLFAGFGLSYEEIAGALDIRIGTVRSRLSRGRTQLRELLAASGQYAVDDDLARVRSTNPEEHHQ